MGPSNLSAKSPTRDPEYCCSYCDQNEFLRSYYPSPAVSALVVHLQTDWLQDTRSSLTYQCVHETYIYNPPRSLHSCFQCGLTTSGFSENANKKHLGIRSFCRHVPECRRLLLYWQQLKFYLFSAPTILPIPLTESFFHYFLLHPSSLPFSIFARCNEHVSSLSETVLYKWTLTLTETCIYIYIYIYAHTLACMCRKVIFKIK